MRISKSGLVAKFVVFTAVLAAAVLANNFVFDQVALAQAKPSALPAVLAQLNVASAKFTSAQADVRQELFTKAVRDTETQTGQIYFLRKAGATQMGMKMLPPDAKPGTPPVQIVEFKDSKLRVYDPGPNQLHEFSTSGKNQTLAELSKALAEPSRIRSNWDDLSTVERAALVAILQRGGKMLTQTLRVALTRQALLEPDKPQQNTFGQRVVPPINPRKAG